MAPKRRVTIAVLDDYQRAAEKFLPLQELREVCLPELTTYTTPAKDTEELVARAGAAEVVIAMRERSRLTADVLAGLERTRLIVTTGARNAAIDTAAARSRGIVVCGTRGMDTGPAELSWALLLALVRRIPEADRGVRIGDWASSVGETLAGKTLGVVGLGTIGRQVAEYGKAFGMRVLASSRSLSPELAAILGVDRVSRERLFREADVVTLHIPLTADTAGFVGARELGWMKRTAYLVNTARGGLVDQSALESALTDGLIRGAALDVYDVEPLPVDSALVGMPNVVLAPHIGYVTEERYTAYYRQAAEIVRRYVQGIEIRVIN